MPQTSHQKKLLVSIILSFSFMIAEFIGGVLTHSLALISDAAHMMTDVSALMISWVAIGISKRPANAQKTFGYYRFEILASTFNTCLLFLIGFYIFIEAIKRFYSPTNINSNIMILIAFAGLVINLVAVSILHSSKNDSLNLKSAYLEVLSDALSSVAVIFSGIFIHFTHFYWIDGFIAILIGVWILPRTWSLLKESLNILLESVPEHMDSNLVCANLKEVSGVLDCHDLHIWSITSHKIILTAHIVIHPEFNMLKVSHELNLILKNKFNIDHTTLQLEYETCQIENHH